MVDYSKLYKNFKIDGEFISCVPYGEGHINETYLLKVLKNGKEVWYILQKINSTLFKEVDKLMSNISLVTDFARSKIIAKGGDPDRETLTLIKTLDDKPYFFNKEDNGYYRVYLFITGAVVYQTVQNENDFYQSALAFGDFANLLAEFDASKLYEILPKFHDTRKRLKDFENSVRENRAGRREQVEREIEFVLSRKDYAGRIAELLDSGKMPLKVTHNDTKLNNVLLDAKTGKYLSVIDLDTIMPGSICYDFGDSIRFGCNPCSEDESDISKVVFDMNLFEVYAKGYLKSLGTSVTKIEKDNLAFSAILMTYECGMRFLADYLDGDIYFHRKRQGQNLDRARTQFKLIEDMEKNYDKLLEIINKY